MFTLFRLYSLDCNLHKCSSWTVRSFIEQCHSSFGNVVSPRGGFFFCATKKMCASPTVIADQPARYGRTLLSLVWNLSLAFPTNGSFSLRGVMILHCSRFTVRTLWSR